MTTQTFEDLIEREYQFDRKGMCSTCTYYCWLHNPFIHCRLLEDNYSPETKPESKFIAYESLTAKGKNSKNKPQDNYNLNKMKGDK